jgi:GAF domain-containing protein
VTTQPDAAFFARISRQLMERPEEAPTFQQVVERAVEAVPAADCCGISLRRRRGRVESAASSSPLAGLCDSLQHELGEGPCLDAVWDRECFLVRDTRSDTRWPRWGPRVAEAGVGSVLSIPLRGRTDSLGALNMYAGRPHAFTVEDVDVALVYAAHAANAMTSARLVSGLQDAVQTRHLIGVAQGILMQRYGLTLEHSFEVLRRYSSERNIKLRELAAQVVEHGRMPGAEKVG